MATDKPRFFTTIEAKEDMDSGCIYHAIALDDGKLANNGGEALGLLYNKPKTDQGATVAYQGEMKFAAGIGVNVDDPLTVATSGWITVAGSGDYIVGRSKVGVSSGSLATGFFDFTKPVYAMSSSFVW